VGPGPPWLRTTATDIHGPSAAHTFLVVAMDKGDAIIMNAPQQKKKD